MSEETLPPVESLTYERALTELDHIVQALEAQDHTLEAAMEMFARGQALSQHCARLLDSAELKLKQISGDTLVEVQQD